MMTIDSAVEVTQLDELFKIASRHPFAKGRSIYSSGPRGFYLVHSGKVKVGVTGPRGNFSFPPLGVGDFFGESFLDCPRDNEWASALTNCEVCIFDTAAVKKAIVSPYFAQALSRHLFQRLTRLEAFYEMQVSYGVSERMLHLLAHLDVDFGTDDKGARLLPHFTHAYLAEMLGTSREIATYCMGKLRKVGVLTYNRKGIRLLPSFAFARVCPKPERYRTAKASHE